MALGLGALHTSINYLTERNANLKAFENADSKLGVHVDLRKFVAIGYGLDLLHNSPSEIAGYYVVANIQYGGQVGLPASAIQLIRNYQRNPSQFQQALLQGFPSLPNGGEKKVSGTIVCRDEVN